MKVSNQEMNPLHEVAPEDAIGMLVADHKRVAALFADFKRLTDAGRDAGKASIVAQICQELTVHTQLEEELFYPAVRAAIDDADQVDEALVEHAGAKELIAQLQNANPEDELYDARVTVLGEQIDHHVEEEEGSMFPKARYAGLDTLELGAAMLQRKAELQSGGTARSARRTSNVDPPADEDDIDQVRPSHQPPRRSRATAAKKSKAPRSKAKKAAKKKSR